MSEKTEKAEKPVESSKGKEIVVNVTIQGLSPLLCHAIPLSVLFPEGGARGISKVGKGEEGGLRENAAKHLYLASDGKTVVMPAANIYKCIMEAGRFHKVGKRQITTRDTSIVPGGMWIEETECSISPQSWEVYSKMVTNEATKSKVPCHRPMWEKGWQIHFSLRVDTGEFALSTVRQLVDDAGRKIGLGSHRPEKKGPFGRFIVTKWSAAA